MSDEELYDEDYEMTDASGSGEDDEEVYESDVDDSAAAVVPLLDDTTLEIVQEDVMHAQLHVEDPDRIRVTPLGPKFTLPVVDMHPATRQACGLLNPEPLYILLDVVKGYKRSSPLPSINIVHGSGQQPSTSSDRPNGKFGIGLQIVNAIQKHLETAWRKRGENFLLDVYRLAEDRLMNCGNMCMLCDRALPFPGLKPTICDDKFCSYQLEKLGIGASLSLIDSDELVADFLICAALAAASSGSRIQFALPNMPVNGKDEEITPPQIVKSLNALPALSDLPAGDNERTETLKKTDEYLETILRWIFATNRAHVVSLSEDERFPEMQTPFQFKINTSTRTHAQAFETMKARHGSFFAWHGSSIANWHNILRNNLKNASNTGMMSAGAAYGPGIYLAGSTAISAGYTHMRGTACQGRFWNSKFDSSLRVLALCEVANAPQVQWHHNTQIIVASEESCVALRYLFIYTTSEPPMVEAKSLKLQKYRNDTTIIGMMPVAEIEPRLLIVTSDNYAWDIEELVQLIESKHGVFINGYTRQGFAPGDVKLIMNHPSGEGKRLSLLEKTNAELRQRIPTPVYARLNQVGAVCIAEQGEDYSRSTQAIIDLKAFIDTLPPEIKEALDRAPFEVVDRHSRLPFRDTVMHEIELVTSAGDCVHRFGDFLSQVRP